VKRPDVLTCLSWRPRMTAAGRFDPSLGPQARTGGLGRSGGVWRRAVHHCKCRMWAVGCLATVCREWLPSLAPAQQARHELGRLSLEPARPALMWVACAVRGA
jgi:hypothetical protein